MAFVFKAYLKHMDCECSKENVSLVYLFLQQALDTLHYVVVDSGSLFDYTSAVYDNSMFKSTIVQISFLNACRQFEVVECMIILLKEKRLFQLFLINS
jgi:hypothetical protein